MSIRWIPSFFDIFTIRMRDENMKTLFFNITTFFKHHILTLLHTANTTTSAQNSATPAKSQNEALSSPFKSRNNPKQRNRKYGSLYILISEKKFHSLPDELAYKYQNETFLTYYFFHSFLVIYIQSKKVVQLWASKKFQRRSGENRWWEVRLDFGKKLFRNVR